MNKTEEIICQTTLLKGFGIDNTKEIYDLLKACRKLHKLAEQYANGEIEGDQYENAIKKPLAVIRGSFNEKKVTVEHQGDPRGAPIILHSDGVEVGRLWGW